MSSIQYKSYRIAPLIIILFIVCSFCFGTTLTFSKITYIQGTIFSSSSDIIKLLDGSRWYSISAAMALPATDIIIVLIDDEGNGIAYSSGFEFPVSLVAGSPITSTGTISYVEKVYGRGAILKLSDGSKWEVSEYDHYYTSYWLAPYKVIVTSNELYMINLKKAKKIEVTRIE